MDRPDPSLRQMGRPRPPVFRALGADEPPLRVEIEGTVFHRVDVFKHDSWAATALYAAGQRQVVCKFNRRQPVGPLPMAWLGRALARRESAMFERLARLPGIPRGRGPVMRNGRAIENAVAHDFIPGLPLGRKTVLPPDYFSRLAALLDRMHRRGVAYVDLHKRENVLVGSDGRPYLLDFQIAFAVPLQRRASTWLLSPLLGMFQKADWHNFRKHELKCQCRPTQEELAAFEASRPWFIRLHRLAAVPFREARRRLLSLLGIRTGRGRAASEVFAEVALR
jgi:hypothetical protein